MSAAIETHATDGERTVRDLVFTGFNSRVIALDRYTGEVVWDWKSPKGTGFISLLLDGDRLIVAVNGYLYCLDPLYGQEVWRNPMRGFGHGVTSLASMYGASASDSIAAIAAQQQAAATAAAASTAAVS